MADDFGSIVAQFGDAVSALNVTVGKIVMLILIILIGLIVGRLAGRLVYALLHELRLDKRLPYRLAYLFSVERFLAGLASWVIYLIAIAIVLLRLGILPLVLNSILAIVAVAILIIMILALKDVIPNIVAGFHLRKRLSLVSGRRVVIGHTRGVVEKSDWTCLELRGTKGEHLIIPYTVAWKSVSAGKKK